MSPMLTNIMMVPIDYEISKTLRNAKVDRENKEEEIKSSFVYTRYADDIQISNRKDFNIKQVEELINQILKNYNAPFRINNKKTRYGSKSGRNWNLGLMLNKDNQLTIGHKRKRQLKAMMNNYLVDRNKNIKWSVEDLMILQGQISYAKQIEKEMIEYIISKTNEKHNSDIINMIKQDIKEQNK